MSPAPRTARPLLAVLTVLLVALMTVTLAGCGGEPVSPTTTASESDAPASGTAPVVKRTVLIDPGHNGGNASHTAQISKKVPDGRGGTKPCNTTGTQTDDGYPEYKFNWDVALRVGELLVNNNVNVKLTRTNDTGVGPCVDARGEMAEQVDADALVSIHADGAAPAGYGFHVAYSKPPLNAAQGAPSLRLASDIRDALRGAGLPESTYLGKDGLDGRSDLAGLNLSARPAVLVECANMRNPQEAVTVSNGAGRQRYAQAIAIGILNWLAQLPPPGKATSTSAGASASASSKHTPKSSGTSASAAATAEENRTTAGKRGSTASSAASDE